MQKEKNGEKEVRRRKISEEKNYTVKTESKGDKERQNRQEKAWKEGSKNKS